MLSHVNIRFFKQAVNAASYKETNLDIACRCPICGDSKVKANSKRLHLYKKGDLELVNCFNAGCAVENKTMYAFLRDFYPNLLPEYKRNTFRDKINELKSLKEVTSIDKKPGLESISDWENSEVAKMESSDKSDSKNSENSESDWINSEIAPQESADITPKPSLVAYDLREFFEDLSNDMIQYLKSRKIEPHVGGTWYKAKTDIKIKDTVYRIKDYLIIPLYYNDSYDSNSINSSAKDKMYGFYSRSTVKKDFITFISTTGFKVWNWFNINKDERTYIFEAIFDAISTGLPNIIANLGAKLPQERLDELKDAVFCLDNDSTGIKMSIQYAEQGHSVYIQPSEYHEKDFNELKINHPDLDIKKFINDNIYRGLPAITRLKMKL